MRMNLTKTSCIHRMSMHLPHPTPPPIPHFILLSPLCVSVFSRTFHGQNHHLSLRTSNSQLVAMTWQGQDIRPWACQKGTKCRGFPDDFLLCRTWKNPMFPHILRSSYYHHITYSNNFWRMQINSCRVALPPFVLPIWLQRSYPISEHSHRWCQLLLGCHPRRTKHGPPVKTPKISWGTKKRQQRGVNQWMFSKLLWHASPEYYVLMVQWQACPLVF